MKKICNWGTQMVPMYIFVNSQIKSHRRGIWVLHKIPQCSFYKNHAYSDMSSFYFVYSFHTRHHTWMRLLVCIHWHLDNVIQDSMYAHICQGVSTKSERDILVWITMHLTFISNQRN